MKEKKPIAIIIRKELESRPRDVAQGRRTFLYELHDIADDTLLGSHTIVCLPGIDISKQYASESDVCYSSLHSQGTRAGYKVIDALVGELQTATRKKIKRASKKNAEVLQEIQEEEARRQEDREFEAWKKRFDLDQDKIDTIAKEMFPAEDE